jgi:hypothetical protein
VAALCEVDSSTTDSSREAQPEIRNAIAKSEAAYDAKRGIIGTNLTSDTFDASRGIRYAYIGSYAWFRSSHVERWDRDDPRPYSRPLVDSSAKHLIPCIVSRLR